MTDFGAKDMVGYGWLLVKHADNMIDTREIRSVLSIGLECKSMTHSIHGTGVVIDTSSNINFSKNDWPG